MEEKFFYQRETLLSKLTTQKKTHYVMINEYSRED